MTSETERLFKTRAEDCLCAWEDCPEHGSSRFVLPLGYDHHGQTIMLPFCSERHRLYQADQGGIRLR